MRVQAITDPPTPSEFSEGPANLTGLTPFENRGQCEPPSENMQCRKTQRLPRQAAGCDDGHMPSLLWWPVSRWRRGWSRVCELTSFASTSRERSVTFVIAERTCIDDDHCSCRTAAASCWIGLHAAAALNETLITTYVLPLDRPTRSSANHRLDPQIRLTQLTINRTEVACLTY